MPTPGLPFTVAFPYPSVATVSVQFDKTRQERWFLLRSDVHHDNMFCRQDMEKRHLDEAVARQAGIIDNGDMFCAMQGKWDRRADQDQLRPEHRGNRYLDALVEEAASFYGPYARNWILFGHGNHETAMIKHHQTDLTERLVGILNDRHGTSVRTHGYAGWVMFHCAMGKHQGNKQTVRLFRHHGYGGGAPVTKGVIQTARMAVWLPDADVVLTGHDHNEFMVPLRRQRVTNQGRPYKDEQFHVKVPGYKDVHGEGGAFNGWEMEKGFAPQTNAAAWLVIRHEGSHETPMYSWRVERAT